MLHFMSMTAACMNKDLDDWLWARETGRPVAGKRRRVFILGEKQRSLGSRLPSGKTSRGIRLFEQKGTNKK
jgi:hypothetical protein